MNIYITYIYVYIILYYHEYIVGAVGILITSTYAIYKI